jgi:signal peptidase I
MTKAKAKTPRTSEGSQQPAATSSAKPDNTRETIESIVIALILAFLFRAFEAEAFEIPTGSMGPTLLGRNKDVECPKCSFPFQAGVSFEVDDFGQPVHYPIEWRNSSEWERRQLAGQRVIAQTAVCPNCRYTMSVDPDHRIDELLQVDHPYSYSGDRIWVSKAPYVVSDPQRWDVAVFKYPLGSNINYIKRVVGLPNERVMIRGGNIHAAPHGQSEFEIQRKPPHKILATLLPVYDTKYFLPELYEKGWPKPWQPMSASTGWKTEEGGKSFTIAADAQGENWLGFQYVPANWEVWEQIRLGRSLAGLSTRPQLVSDFCGYNTATWQAAPFTDPRALGIHWVGDLSLLSEFEVKSDQGEIELVLVEGGRLLRCTIDVATGKVTLSIDGQDDFRPEALSGIRRPGTYQVRFANVDDQLLVWVDGSLLEFSHSTAYTEVDRPRPTAEDLTPARIGVRGAEVSVSRLRLDRDIYYIASRSTNQFSDYIGQPWLTDLNPDAIADFLSSPERWDAFRNLASVEFDLDNDHFLMLGDNSPHSGDSRYWYGEHSVGRELIIGKAFFVYWPHAWETTPSMPIPFRGRSIRVPFYPNVWEMRLIR